MLPILSHLSYPDPFFSIYSLLNNIINKKLKVSATLATPLEKEGKRRKETKTNNKKVFLLKVFYDIFK